MNFIFTSFYNNMWCDQAKCVWNLVLILLYAYFLELYFDENPIKIDDTVPEM